MNARISEYRMLWRAAATHANPRLAGIIRWGGSFVALVIGTVVGFKHGPRAALAWFWGAASLFLLLEWAWRFMPGAVKLNSPANAKLVPQMRRRLVELSCLVCWAGIAGIASAPYADASGLGTWLLWIVIFLVGTGLGTAGHQAGSVIIITACFSTLFFEHVSEDLIATLSHPLVVVLSLPVYAGVILVAVRAMFPQAGERHWNMLARRARWATAAGKPDPLLDQVAGKEARGWYGATLRRDSAQRDGGRLMLHALGPSHHIGESVLATGLIAAVVLALGIFTTWRLDADAVTGIGWIFACMLMVVPLSYGVRLGQLSGNLVSEQALVRMTPAVPAQAGAFNVRLGRSLLRQVFTCWLLAAGVALLLTALGGAGPEALLRVTSVACLVLPVVATPLRNHARRRESAIAAAVMLLVSAVGGLILGASVNAVASLPILPVAAVCSIGFTVYVVVRGLRAMERAPCAFPAGRMD